MSEINNEEKQNINNIKLLYKLNADGVIPSLFREVKKAKQQTFALVNACKDKLAEIKKDKETKLKQELLKQVREEEMASNKTSNSVEKETASFAELFEGQESKKEQPKQTVKEPEKEETPVKEVTTTPTISSSTETSTKPSVPQNQTEVSRPTQKPTPYKNDGLKPYTPRYQNNDRPQNNYRNGQNSYSNHNNYNQQNGYNRGGYNPRPYDPNRHNNSTSWQGQKPYGNNQRPFNRPQNNGYNQGAHNGYNKGQNTPNNALRGQNKPLMNIIPKKNTILTDANTAFANKERTFGNKKKTNERAGDEERRINKKSLIRRGLIEEQNIEERMVTRKLKLKKQKVEVAPVVCAPVTNAVITTSNLTVKILSEKIGKPVTEIIKQLMVLGIMTTINSNIDFPTAELVASELGVTLELKVEKSFEEKLKENAKIDDGNNTEKRAPIVTIVGHVDHGKTTLLDYIRKTHITSKEAGGITQSIGAYSISWNGEDITFVDTPGHEAFINMRKRGTEITDVAVLTVAGDDGIKPQTVEAINHIKQAKVPMVVAITKIDKQDVNIERVKQQLTEHEILPEEWGGDTIIVPISAITGEGVDKLLETILLVAEMQDLKCNKKREAVGVVIEAELDKNRGPIANIIVQNGTLKLGDNVVSGFAIGKVRAMIDSKGKSISKAGPSTPVSVLGLDGVPNAGDTIQVVDEKFSKNVVKERNERIAQEKIENGAKNNLADFLATNQNENKKSLPLLLKANSQGSVEALKQSLLEIVNEEVKIEVVSSGVGNINENDIQLAKVSNATIIAFDTKVLTKISNFAKQNKVEIKEYNIIYKAIEDVEKLLKSMMAPKYEEKIVGHAEVRALFKISSIGTIAGCYVLDGKVVRNAETKITRSGEIVFEGKIATLKRNKDDAKEVAAGYECGIKIESFNDIQEGDIIECIVKQQINL